MPRLRWFGVVGITTSILFSLGCNSETDDEPSLTPKARLTIRATPSSIGEGESTALSIEAKDASGNAGVGTVQLTSPAGALSPATVTLSDGKATSTFTCNVSMDAGCVGSVQVMGSWEGTSSGVAVTVTGVTPPAATPGGSEGEDDEEAVAGPPSSIGWTATNCSGNACEVMGIKGSGFNEQSQVSFVVQDAGNRPVQGVSVTFTLQDAPSGTALTSATATTNSEGVATALVTSGPVIGAFAVRAAVASPALESISPTIGVRGAKAANRGFRVVCDRVNLDAYTSAQSPKPIDVACSVGLVDRYNNPVGTGTPVFLKTEAGSLTNSVSTQAFDPAGSNDGEGTGNFTFHTFPGPMPQNVAPFDADAAQWPYPRVAEERLADTGYTFRNPRDQLVTVLAYVQGEEFFDDTNSNGAHDASERFIDQPEPFVDANDNNSWDLGEVFIDVDKDGTWDAANGTWDANTTIWAEHRFLYTGYVSSATSVIPTSFAPACPGGLTKAASTTFGVAHRDAWLNVPVGGANLAVAYVGTKGSATLASGATMLDSYGFGYERVLVDASNDQECVPATSVCEWKTVFYDWLAATAVVKVTGAPTTDATSCVDGVVKASATVNGVTTTVETTGGVQ